MASKGQTQPGNLKERIAALEQRNAALSAADRPSSPSIPFTSGAVANPAGLRDKIAKFEKKGGVPVPRGSFGLGAPPLAENAPQKRRGELYGNRISSMRAASGTSVGRAGSPLDAGRIVSMPNLDGVSSSETDSDYLPSSPSSTASSPLNPPFTGLSPQHTGTAGVITPQLTGSALTPQYTGSREPTRATSFAAALERARKAETEAQNEASVHSTSITRVPLPATTSTSDIEEKPAHTAFSPASPSSSVPNNQKKVDVAQEVSSPIKASVSVSGTELVSPTQPSTPPLVLSPSDEHVISTQEEVVTTVVASVPIEAPASSVQESAKVKITEAKAEPTEPVAPASSSTVTPIIVTPASEPKPVESENDKPTIASQTPATSTLYPITPDGSALSPLGPFSLVNAVHDLGKVVANIQDMFPGQISPLSAPPLHRPLVIDTPSTSKEPQAPVESKKFKSDLELKLDSPSEAAPAVSATHVSATSSLIKPTELLTSPRSGNARPVSMIETSPSHVVVASREPPATARDVSVVRNEPQKLNAPANKYEHFPPTPEPGVSEFGTVSMGPKSSHSITHGRSSMEQNTNPGSFSAVVHKKVTELPSTTMTTTSSSYLSFYTKVSETPKKASEAEGLMSPGSGELAALLQETALLQFSLEQGELPSEAAKKTEFEQGEQEKQRAKEEEEREKQVADRAKVEEEKKKHTTVAKARGKQEASESKSKSAFRNPLLRSKSAQKRDGSTDGEARKEPARSKSVILPFRPLPELPSLQTMPTSVITSIPEKEAVSPVDAAPEAESKSPTHASSKSRRYFGLKRFASSRTSLTSASQPRNSVSASSEMSSEDSSLPTPPGNDGETESKGGLSNGSGIAWPSLSPKRSQAVGRSASFTDKIFNRNRKTSTVSSMNDENSAYEAIDRLAKSRAGKSAASLIPPLDPVSFTLDVPIIQDNDQPLPSPPELVSPRRSASLYVPSASQFPPVLSARPTSSFFTSIPQPSDNPTSSRPLESVDEDKLASPNFTSIPGTPQQSIDALFSAKPTSPVYTPYLGNTSDIGVPAQTPSTNTTHKQPQSLDATLFSVNPTSPVYTLHVPALAMRSEETITDSPVLPSPDLKKTERPGSWISDVSMDSFASSIPSPFFDSFPSVPLETPLPPALPGRQRNSNKPSLPPPSASFFETAASLSSAAVGSEFFAGPRSSTVKSASMPQASGEYHRS